MIRLIKGFLQRRDGATAIEYALIAGLISILIVTGVGAIGTNLNAKYTAAASALS